MLESLVMSGRIADIILAVMAVEAALTVYWARRGSSMAASQSYLAGLVAGASLVLALRAALTGAGWVNITIYLTTALFAHLAELGLRRLR